MNVVAEFFKKGRCGTLIDMPEDGNTDPSFMMYKADCITNWFSETIDGKEQLVDVTLLEDDFDEWGEPVKRYRRLYLDDGVYTQDLYDEYAALKA
jgi:hypothetical protein